MSCFKIVRVDQFIQATRDSGYKGTDSAMSELVDNSIQAGATRVCVRLIGEEQPNTGLGRPKLPRVSDVGICDNGHGMAPDSLRRSLRFGDGSRFDDRCGLGRFGMGLPNASVSQCRRLEVYSWQDDCVPLCTYIDVDQIASGTMVEVPVPTASQLPTEFRDLAKSSSGTLVVWRKCDRLDYDGKIETLENSLRHNLGRMFRYFLAEDFELFLDGHCVEPIDPLYLLPEARMDKLAEQYGETIEFDVSLPRNPDQTSKVEVTFSLLPESWQINAKRDKGFRKSHYFDSTAGFSIVRHDREIDLIKNPYHKRHWTDSWYRVEIRFEPELDELFGVTHTKQHAKIPDGSDLYEQLRPCIVANVSAMKELIVARRKRPQKNENNAYLEQCPVRFQVGSLPGEPFYWTKVVGDSIVVFLNNQHPFYEQVYCRSDLETAGIELLIGAMARSEILGSKQCKEWYKEQREAWSLTLLKSLGAFDTTDQLEDDCTCADFGQSTENKWTVAHLAK